MSFQVIVGNLGTVYDGPDRDKAEEYFTTYKEQSERNYGRAAGEAVSFLEDNNIIREHPPSIEEAEEAAEEE